MLKKPVKAVLPVAGWGTRWLPSTKSIPKELLPVVDIPIVHHVVEEAVESDLTDFLLVYSEGKESILDYFKEHPELERILEEKGKIHCLDRLTRLMERIRVQGVIQHNPRGLGHAVGYAETFAGNEPVAVLLPDDLVMAETPCMKQLMAAYQQHGGAILALEQVPEDQISNYGVIRGEPLSERVYRVNEMVEKPSPDKAPSNLAVIGRYILPPEIFQELRITKPGSGGEIQLTDAIAGLISSTGVTGVVFEGARYDAGRPLGWLFTNLSYFLSDPRFSREVRDYLSKIVSLHNP